MGKNKVLEELLDARVVAIARKVPYKDITATAQALLDGGIKCMEITFDHESDETRRNTCDSIKKLKEAFQGQLLIGVGTVLTAEQVKAAVDAGAEYIISPNTNFEVIKTAKQLGKIAIPGAFTPTEIIGAYEAGADIVKVFPANALGTGYIKAFKNVYANIPLFAVGGIDAENAGSFIKAGAAGVGVGGNLVSRTAIAEGKFNLLTEAARKLIQNL